MALKPLIAGMSQSSSSGDGGGGAPSGPAGGDLSGTYPNPLANLLHDSSDPANLSVDGINRQLFDSFPYLSVDWQNRTLNDANAFLLSLDWNNRKAYDATVKLAVDYNARLLYDETGLAQTVDWQNGFIGPVGNPSIDWSSKLLNHNDGSLSINWQFETLNHNGTLSVDWANHLLTVGATTYVDWSSGLLNDSSFISIDWINRVLNDAGGTNSIDYKNRFLCNDGGTSVITWNTLSLFSLVGSRALSIDWNARLLYALDGTTPLLDWHSDTTNTASAAYWFDSANGNRLTGVGLGLTGTLTIDTDWVANESVGDKTIAVQNYDSTTLDGMTAALNLVLAGFGTATAALADQVEALTKKLQAIETALVSFLTPNA